MTTTKGRFRSPADVLVPPYFNPWAGIIEDIDGEVPNLWYQAALLAQVMCQKNDRSYVDSLLPYLLTLDNMDGSKARGMINEALDTTGSPDHEIAARMLICHLQEGMRLFVEDAMSTAD
jgi:hypothetical protein